MAKRIDISGNCHQQEVILYLRLGTELFIASVLLRLWLLILFLFIFKSIFGALLVLFSKQRYNVMNLGQRPEAGNLPLIGIDKYFTFLKKAWLLPVEHKNQCQLCCGEFEHQSDTERGVPSRSAQKNKANLLCLFNFPKISGLQLPGHFSCYADDDSSPFQ